jgi:hypothetical protein
LIKVTRPLTKKESAWLEHYKVSGNTTESARVAGYSGDNLHIIGHQIKTRLVNLENGNCELTRNREEQITEVISFWINIMNSTEVSNREKIQCSKLYATYLGMFNSQNNSKEQNMDEGNIINNSMALLSYDELQSLLKSAG